MQRWSSSRCTVVVLALLVGSVIGGSWPNCPSTLYCEFELLLSAQLSIWPGVSNTTFFADLASATQTNTQLFYNMTKIFETVVIGVLDTSRTYNASETALSVVTQINAQSSTSVQSFSATYHITSAVYGYKPVVVPSYLRISDEPDQTIFAVLGGIAALLVVVQFAYGYWHFQGFGFITTTKDERD